MVPGGDGGRQLEIAIDTSALRFPPSGVRTYVDQLLLALQAHDSGLTLERLDPVPQPGVDQMLSRRQRAAWDLVGVGRAADHTGADVLHVPQFSAPFRTKLPLVVTVHDVIPLLFPEYRTSWAMRLYLAAARRSVLNADRVICPTEAAAVDAIDLLSLPRENVRVVPMAADRGYRPAVDQDEAWRRVRRLGISGPFVFNVGGFDRRKQLPLLIEAFAQARPQLGESWGMVIAGAPHSKNPAVYPSVQAAIARHGLGNAVTLTGPVSQENKIALYQTAGMYVTPSLYEGFGLTALEAMQTGTPVIATPGSGLGEVVGDGGLLVCPDADSLAKAMVAIGESTELAKELREAGQERATVFSWERTASMTVQCYREAIESARRAGRRRG